MSAAEGGVIDWENEISLSANFLNPASRSSCFFWMLPTVTFFVCLFYMKEYIPFPQARFTIFHCFLLKMHLIQMECSQSFSLSLACIKEPWSEGLGMVTQTVHSRLPPCTI